MAYGDTERVSDPLEMLETRLYLPPFPPVNRLPVASHVLGELLRGHRRPLARLADSPSDTERFG
jgi:hypothetical protein